MAARLSEDPQTKVVLRNVVYSDIHQASAALKDVLAKNPPKELAVDAEFYLGTIDSQTGKLPEAVKQSEMAARPASSSTRERP